MLDLGYEPLPIRPNAKIPAVSRWSQIAIDAARIDDWCATHGHCGVGLRTGRLVGLDIDLLDADAAHAVMRDAVARFGEAPTRVGRWPKRLLLFRSAVPFRKFKAGAVEVLGHGQQFVAFGIHPDTAAPYSWPLGDTPLDVALSDLPEVDEERLRASLGEWSAVSPARPNRRPQGMVNDTNIPHRNAEGRVTDGRDGWLSRIAYHVVWDAIEAGHTPDPDMLTERAWQRFDETTDFTRQRSFDGMPWAPCHVRQKVFDKLRLLSRGQLPPRTHDLPDPNYAAPADDVTTARQRLAEHLNAACTRLETWHRAPNDLPPRLGIKATVGLGKSTQARKALLEMTARLKRDGLAHRIVVLVPSHRLAEEAAQGWQSAGASVAVLKGYDRKDPVSGNPMCRNQSGVALAIRAGVPIHTSVCQALGGRTCRFFATCPKQENRRAVAAADVILAPNPVLFTGFAIDPATVALILIDEAIWPQALREERDFSVEALTDEILLGGRRRSAAPGDLAELDRLRRVLADALLGQGPGHVIGESLRSAGISAADCRLAAKIEAARRTDPKLLPNTDGKDLMRVERVADRNEQANKLAFLWKTLANLAETDGPDGRVRVEPPDRQTGRHELVVSGTRLPHPNLGKLPILHLDATLRPDLAAKVLPGLSHVTVEASAPHMSVHLIAGRFTKSALLDGLQVNSVSPGSLLDGVVDYLRWHRLGAPAKRALVITHKAVEAAFADIPGVETAHFNAVAGLDSYRDAAQLFVVGRPLPSTGALKDIASGLLGLSVDGCYTKQLRSVFMRDGSIKGVRVVGHDDAHAETLRAAICDDELIQAIGRGRGINRDPEHPLEVHILADVALPLVHDRVSTWDLEQPGIFQRMLIAGIAVSSPADAAALHPQLFATANQAKQAFRREGFKGQTTYKDTISKMTLKSARYRRPGRGSSWQQCWWVQGDAERARDLLAIALGPIEGFEVRIED